MVCGASTSRIGRASCASSRLPRRWSSPRWGGWPSSCCSCPGRQVGKSRRCSIPGTLFRDHLHPPAAQPAHRKAIDPGLLHLRSAAALPDLVRSEEHTSELQSLMRISYAVFCLKTNIRANNEDYTPTDIYDSIHNRVS